MKKLKTSLLLFFLLSTIVYGQNNGDYVYQENFDNKGSWPIGSNEKRVLNVYNGKYYFEHKRTEESWKISTSSFNLDTSKDFEIEISIQKISGVENSGISFLYDFKDADNYKEFGYTSNGYFRVAESVAGAYSNLKKWTKSSFIKTGNYENNKLKITKKGSSVTFYINNYQAHNTSFKSFVGEQLALTLYKNQKVSIDYIKVKQIGSNTNNNTYTSNKTILFDGFNNNDNDWPLKNDTDVALEIKNGDYIFDHKRESGGWSATLTKKINTSRNFKISAQIKKISGIQNNGFGLIYGRQDSNNQNQFFLSGNGSYVIKYLKNGKQTFTKNWTESSHIKTGNGVVNYLKIEKEGSKLKYYINSNLVHTSYSFEFYGDKTGFVVYGKQKVSIGYISMAYTDSKTNNKNSIKKDKTTKTIVYDSFYSNKNEWGITDNDKAKLEIKNSKYYFEYKGDKGWTSTKGFDFDKTRDFKAEASIQKISGIKNNGFGLVFGREDSDNQHQFLINALGSYSIDRYVNGKLTTLIDWTKSSSIKKENYSTNILKIEKRGNKLQYYINSTLVYTESNITIQGKRYGFSIFDPQKIAIDYFYLSYLDNSPNDNNIFKNNTKFKGDLLFSDNFDNTNTNEWSTQNDEKIHFRFLNDKYHVQHKRKDKGWSTYITKKIDSSKDFEIETKIDKISGVTNNSYGLTWGLDDNNNGFRFFIASTGYYKIARTINNKEEVIVKWTKSSNINQDNGASNILKVRREGENYKYYINDRYITKTDFEPFYGDKIGYVVYADQEIAIDYLKIYQSKSNNNNTTITNKKLTLPLFDDFNGNTNNWNLEDSDDYSVAIANSKLLIHKKKEGGIFISRDVTIDTSKDFIIETALSRVTKSTDGLYGITFGRKNSSNEYSFLFSGNGSYIYRKFDNDVYKKIIPFTESSAIKTDLDASNKVKIVKSGNLLRFYINDQYVNETPFEGFFGNKFGYTVYYDKKISVDYLDIKYQSSSFNNPPVVVISSPNVEAKRGFKIVKTKRILVKGNATDADGIYEITVNGIEANVSEDGTFTANVPLKYGKNDLIVKATDLKQSSSTKTFVIKRTSPVIVDDTTITDNTIDKLDIGFGKYHALIIGVSEYTDESIIDLNGEPTKDADALARLLISKYNFDSQNVTILKNPKENEIIKEFYKLRKNVGENDNLVIFYAGHGNYDEASEKGYWMPADAEMEFEGNVILNTSIVSYIKSINSKHTLLIADACFSGSILSTNRNYSKASDAVKTKYSLPSRRAITSGTLTTVPNKSVFMKYLLKRLTENTKTYLSAGQLFNMIEDPVINNTSGDNKPQYAPITRTGDEGGDFIFIKNN